MSTRFTHPGVYFEEIESSVSPIVRVHIPVGHPSRLILTGPITANPAGAGETPDSTWPRSPRRRQDQIAGAPHRTAVTQEPTISAVRPQTSSLERYAHEAG